MRSARACRGSLVPGPDGGVGPITSEGRPIVAELVLDPMIWPNCRNASGSARLARMTLVKIISSRAFSEATS